MDARTRHPSPDGFALPWIILSLALLGLLASAGFLLAWFELRSARGFANGGEAFHAVDGALWETLATTAGTPPAVRPVAVGRARVTVRFEPLLRLTRGEALYRVVAAGALPLAGGDSVARAVEAVAWAADPVRPAAALTAGGDVRAPAARGRISGQDATPGCGVRFGPAVAGLSLPGAASAGLSPALQVTGQPPVARWPAGSSVRRDAGLDWPDLLASHAPDRDAIVPPDPWPTASGTSPWPVIEARGAVVRLGPAHAGRGALLVPGTLELLAGFQWDGLLLVGGALRVLGDVTIRGAAFAGLDTTSVATPTVDLGAADVRITFDSCAVEGAAAGIATRAAALPGTWREGF